MTADIKLLPLTKYLYGREASDNERVVTVADAHAYAIRNVAHHTAAKDAEIARWKEAAEWRGSMTKELLPYQDEAVAGRAEIEALKAALKPICRDAEFDRTYIPLPGGWEIQTKGKGSSFRIVGPGGNRLIVPESPYLHKTLEQMALDIHQAVKDA